MNDVLIDSDLNIASLKVSNREEVIRILSEKLLKRSYVKESFPEAVLRREIEFPTGLPTDIPIAMPHADAQYCRHAAIAIATLKKPVKFFEMGNPQKELNVHIVFMLSIINPDSQITWLKKLTTIFGDTSNLNLLLHAVTAETLTEIFKEFIEK